MELSLLLANKILELFLIVFVGYFVVKKKLFKVEDSRVLSLMCLYIVCPCTIINAFQIEFTPDKLKGLILAFVAAAISEFIFYCLTKVLKKPLGLLHIEQATLIYSNAGNLIIPLVTALLGNEWVLYTSGYIIVQTILLWTHCFSLVSGETKINWGKILTNINVISIIIGIVLFVGKIQLPTVIQGTISSIGAMIGPLSMLVIGMSLGNMDLKSIFTEKRTYLISFLRLIAYPVVMILIFQLIGIRNFHPQGQQILLITTLAASAPAASTITQFAQIYNKHPGYASIMNVMTVIFCIVTMPLMIYLYQLF